MRSFIIVSFSKYFDDEIKEDEIGQHGEVDESDAYGICRKT
jgi:hypothetical protein